MVWRFLYIKYPESLEWLSKYSDEVYLAFNLFLQWNSLRSHHATFAEKFYGLTRASTNNSGQSRTWTTILIEVLFPYFVQKLDRLHSNAAEDLQTFGRLHKVMRYHLIVACHGIMQVRNTALLLVGGVIKKEVNRGSTIVLMYLVFKFTKIIIRRR